MSRPDGNDRPWRMVGITSGLSVARAKRGSQDKKKNAQYNAGLMHSVAVVALLALQCFVVRFVANGIPL